MRELMRRKRAANKTANKTSANSEPANTIEVDQIWAGAQCDCKRWGEGVPIYVKPHTVDEHDKVNPEGIWE